MKLLRYPEGFQFGCTHVWSRKWRDPYVGMDFMIQRLRQGEHFSTYPELEHAALLVQGAVRFKVGGQCFEARRRSVFEDPPAAMHHAARTSVEVEAIEDSEIAVFAAENEADFDVCFFCEENLADVEHRDKGKYDDTAYRIVTTIFDVSNRPLSKMVLGEVLTLPGRWSSYPPHHHPHPEIYHYRFEKPQGYGHAEHGEEVAKVRNYDTLIIEPGNDHAQVAAPGYAMYYIFAIRHLENNQYISPDFTEEHRWLQDPAAKIWRPK